MKSSQGVKMKIHQGVAFIEKKKGIMVWIAQPIAFKYKGMCNA